MPFKINSLCSKNHNRNPRVYLNNNQGSLSSCSIIPAKVHEARSFTQIVLTRSSRRYLTMQLLTVVTCCVLFVLAVLSQTALAANLRIIPSTIVAADDNLPLVNPEEAQFYEVSTKVTSPPTTAQNLALNSLAGQKLFLQLLMRQETEKKPNNALELLRYLETQVNLGACAAASAVTVLNAMDFKKPEDPAYAMFGDESFPFWTQTTFVFEQCVKDILHAHVYGVTLDDFGKVMKCLGVKVDCYHAEDKESFRQDLIDHLNAGNFVIANFDRALVHERTGGHFSPVAGFIDGYFLVLDVARYKFPPVFVPSEDLVKAMASRDLQSGANRGYCALSNKK